MPIWIPFASLGINAALLGLKHIAPKIPGWLVPFINLGIGAGIGLAQSHGVPTGIDPTTVLATSGLAALTHNAIKNGIRGDKFGEGAITVPKPGLS